jgi:5-hydroxyisourate hydrolase
MRGMRRSAAPFSLGDLDLLRPLPQGAPPDFGEVLEPRSQGGEVVAGERPDARAEAACPIGEENLALGELADVDQDLPRCRMGGVILVADVRAAVAERDPGRLAAPATVDQLRADGEPGAQRVACPRRRRLPARGELQVANTNRQIVGHAWQHTAAMAAARHTISTHVLDLASGHPAPGVSVALFHLADDGRPELIAEAETDADGRIADLLDGQPMREGDYQLAFDVGGYADADDAFFQSMAVALRVTDVGRSYHVPLLLSPFGMSTYRGS